MKISVEKSSDNMAILKCAGSLDAATVANFKSETAPLKSKGFNNWILDATSLEFIDSTGLGALVSIQRQLKEAGGEIKLASLQADVLSIFQVTRLNRVFDICAAVKDACVRFKNVSNS